MKRLNEVFTDEEFTRLKKAKDNKSWHDFIMTLAAILSWRREMGNILNPELIPAEQRKWILEWIDKLDEILGLHQPWEEKK